MERRTMTTLGELRIGDSFVYPKRVDPWRVMAKADKNGKVAVNQVLPWGKVIHKFDELKIKTTKVMFLRHTVPVPHEEIFLEDLKEGDIFQMPEDIVHEYELVKKGVEFFDCRRTDQPTCIKGGRLATVIFIRHKEQ